ncbi:hypothetical protein MCC01967_05380 [Bifidobacteriaceae bacterium MCC01967]|nr:hypothetical protein MCC01967_05380 [Bifidobacteriaceae bacterium MCC01967]GDZ64730.1 hypothetical protein MCC02038_15700 [Bifidobacteriaceae bacterium MCC02038]
MAALRAGNGNAGQADKPAPRRSRNAGAVCDDAEASRRGAEESGPEDALMREVAEVAGKDPGADPRRLSNRGDAAGRPSEAGVFARLDDMPARHRAGRPPLPPRRAER